MLVAVHNPANLAIEMPSIAVPHGKLDVKRFDVELKQMVHADGTVLCNLKQRESYAA
jgi:hypothetical protein